MRVGKNRFKLAGLVLGLGVIGVAAAQPLGDAAPQLAGQAGDRQEVRLSPQQMLAAASQFLPEMDQGAVAVQRQLAKAREERDVVKVLCLDDKLAQIRVAISSAKDRLTSLQGAIAKNDQDRAHHEYTVLLVLRDRVRMLVTEANQCIGEEAGFVGDSYVTVDIDPGLPQTDPSEFREEPHIISQPPVVSSPIQ